MANTNHLPAPGTYAIDASHTHVGFAVKHFGLSKVKGEFEKFDGSLTVAEDPTQSSVSVTIKTDSFNSRDDARDVHVRSEDFLHTVEHPEITFRSTSVSGDGDDWTVVGDLTIKGVTHPVELDVEFEGTIVDPYGFDRIAFSAETEIDRTDFGLAWNQVLETGGMVVGKKVKIILEVEATKPSA